MSDKKQIDRLFQEKLKDLEITPDQLVWKSIQADLNKKKKDRKVIPLWFKLSGIATSIILLIAIGSYFNKDSEPTLKETLVDSPIGEENNNTNLELENKTPKTNQKNFESVDKNLTPKPNQHTNLTGQNKKDNIVSNTTNTEISKSTKNLNKLSKNSVNQEIVNTKNQNIPQLKKEKNIQFEYKTNEFLESNKINSEKALVNNNTKTEIDTSIENKKTNKEQLIEETENAITEVIASNEEKEDIKIEEEAIKRWSINPNVAPVYFSSIGDGSSIHSQFNNNAKTGKINMSYGISASYALTDKISVRTGLNLVNLGYSTNDVSVLSRTVSSGSLNQNLYKNIDFNNTSRSMTILNINQPFSEDLPSTLPNKIKGELDQELAYIEVPIEVEYKLMDNKFGISFIGGFSTLFLNNNEIYVINNGEKTLIGEATNVNNTSFSANLGLGLNYNLTKSINLNVE
ncbi:MAG: hypothetical protein KJN82_00735, partial [Bacteroidia bacterium]|nr:hypothetical protein [Bacteroidia bacterium]